MSRFIRKPDVLTMTGLKQSTLFELIQAGTFPKPVKIGPRAAAWPEEEVNNWMAERIAKRDAAAA
ncbi:MAG: AlpA family transcriptional regulator [Mesorhizobium sp.]|nr:MAG: AlpA family transcriptional regulator [Mesorhizobium sp.]